MKALCGHEADQPVTRTVSKKHGFSKYPWVSEDPPLCQACVDELADRIVVGALVLGALDVLRKGGENHGGEV